MYNINNYVNEIQGNQLLDITQTQPDSLRTNADIGCKSLVEFFGYVTVALGFRKQT